MRWRDSQSNFSVSRNDVTSNKLRPASWKSINRISACHEKTSQVIIITSHVIRQDPWLKNHQSFFSVSHNDVTSNKKRPVTRKLIGFQRVMLRRPGLLPWFENCGGGCWDVSHFFDHYALKFFLSRRVVSFGGVEGHDRAMIITTNKYKSIVVTAT